MGACDVDGNEAASLIYPSSLLPTAFCIWFPWKSTFSDDLSSQELQADFFNLHNTVIYAASREAAKGKKGEGVTRARTFPGASTYSMFKTSEAMEPAIYYKALLVTFIFPFSCFICSECVWNVHVCR